MKEVHIREKKKQHRDQSTGHKQLMSRLFGSLLAEMNSGGSSLNIKINKMNIF